MKPETKLQVDVVSWMRMKWPNLLFTSTQAGDRRSVIAAVMMKRMGYSNGTPDLLIFSARGGWNGLLVEIKTSTGVLSDAQQRWRDRASEENYLYEAVFGIDQAKDVIERYMLCV